MRGCEDTPYGEPIRPPSLKEQRRKVRKAKRKAAVEELLESQAVDVEAMKRSGDRRFKISADGRDALLCFGKHDGKTITDLKVSREGRSYLQWILKEEFPEPIKRIIRLYVDEPRRARPSRLTPEEIIGKRR